MGTEDFEELVFGARKRKLVGVEGAIKSVEVLFEAVHQLVVASFRSEADHPARLL